MNAKIEKVLTWEVAEEMKGEYIVIPNGYTEIEESAFEARDDIVSVTIPESMKVIGAKAFHLCISLTDITIPVSVTSIGKFAFSDCHSMTKIEVDMNNQNYLSIDGVLFNKDKTTLIKYPIGKTDETYLVPYGVTAISNNAFPFSKFTSVIIPDGVTHIGSYAFNECRSLTHVTMPDSITNIGYRAFSVCLSLKNIAIPDNVLKIGGQAFYACESLTSINIPKNVTEIDEYSFYRCESLVDIMVSPNNPNFASSDGVLFNKDKTVLIKIPIGKTGAYIIPESVTELGRGAISECGLLTEITFPDNIKGIDIDTFGHCMSLKYITVGANNPECSSEDGVLFNKDKTELIEYPCQKPDKTYTIPDTVTIVGERSFEGNAILTCVKIPDSVKRIESKAFSDCKGLTDIFIPASVEIIRQYVFNHCDALKEITISEDNPHYTSVNKVLFNKNKTQLIEYSDREAEDNYVIPDTVTVIGWFAFCACESLKSVIIPEGVESIGMHAFEGCSGLTEIKLPSSMTFIDHDTFSKCSNLRKITIPDSITEIDVGPIIEAYPFYGCHPEAVATYKGKTYHAQELFSRKPYTNLPKEFYEAIGTKPRNRKNTLTIVVDGSSESWEQATEQVKIAIDGFVDKKITEVRAEQNN